ncbi:phospholipase D-like domain-containing protein [Helicobacter sp. 11S03491-1]|uniref:phospholipase D-like domain-containing protein n=1 Tax=Helicobacter sp. 11S03491-1 TaxID=1476196 RepID=UPI000BA69BB4|nr:phospholipase D-like domain-containing protein [Helicobacter sp. 11S03491-1]PAF41147.1 nuclease NucT [Helicobacter sp. 11S03491-1]
MKNIIFRFLLIFLLFNTLYADKMLYFMPYEQKNALNSLIKSIQSSHKNIDISIYSFTHREIAKALKNAAKRGVNIRIIYDYESNINNPYSTIGYLSKYNHIQTCLLQGQKKQNKHKQYFGIMHQKLAIIDNHTLILGSANWSKNAFENNYEVLLLSDDTTLIAKAKNYYNKMFKRCTPY